MYKLICRTRDKELLFSLLSQVVDQANVEIEAEGSGEASDSVIETPGANLEDLIYSIIRKRPVNTEYLAARTGLPLPALKKILEALSRSGKIKEVAPPPRTGPGRRAKPKWHATTGMYQDGAENAE